MRKGAAGLFAGVWPAMLMAPGAVLQYSMMDPLRARMSAVPASCVAAFVEITIKCPFELVRTQLQGGAGGSAARGIIASTIMARGFIGLWSGYGATLARDIPYTIAKWCVPTAEAPTEASCGQPRHLHLLYPF